MSIPLTGAGRASVLVSRAAAISRITGIVGSDDLVLLYVPNGTDTTESTESSSAGRTITWDADISGRFTPFGNGWMQSFNGSSNYGILADNDAFSFGDGTDDSPFWIAWCGILSTTSQTQTLLAKTNVSNREWRFMVANGGALLFAITDESASGATALVVSTATMPTGTPIIVTAAYDPAVASGASAAGGMTLTLNGAPLSVTPTNSASYVAMENKDSGVEMGARIANSRQDWLSGYLGLDLLAAGVPSASQVGQVASACRSLYGAAL